MRMRSRLIQTLLRLRDCTGSGSQLGQDNVLCEVRVQRIEYGTSIDASMLRTQCIHMASGTPLALIPSILYPDEMGFGEWHPNFSG